MKRSLLLLGLVLAWPSLTHANPVEMVGFGTNAPARGNAMVASLDGLSASVYNPASGAFEDEIQLGFGYTYGRVAIDLDRRDPNILDVRAFWAAVVAPFDLGPAHFDFGLSLHLPDQFIVRLQSVPASEERAVLWDNSPHRIVVAFSTAFRIGEVFSFGVGVSILGDVGGRGADFTIDAQPGGTVAEADIDLELPLRLIPSVGVIVRPVPELRLGVRFMDESRLGVTIPVDAAVTIPGTTLAGNVVLDFIGQNYFSPRELTLGGAFEAGPWTFSLEVAWQQWSRIESVTAVVDIDIDLGIDLPLDLPVVPAPAWDDIFVPRVGVEHRIDVSEDMRLALRLGYWFVPDMVPEQTGLTSYGNSDRHVVTAGGAFSFPIRERRLEVELAVQAHHLPEHITRKDAVGAPGGDLVTGGQVFVSSVGLRLEL